MLTSKVSTFVINSSGHVRLPVLLPQPALGALDFIASKLLLMLPVKLLHRVIGLTHTQRERTCSAGTQGDIYTQINAYIIVHIIHVYMYNVYTCTYM